MRIASVTQNVTITVTVADTTAYRAMQLTGSFCFTFSQKMKIVILLLAVLATIDAAAVQNVKAADKPGN